MPLRQRGHHGPCTLERPQWGGRRPGAGRPLKGAHTQKLSITLPEDLLGQLDQEAYRQQLTRSAVITDYLRRGLHPKEKKTNPVKHP